MEKPTHYRRCHICGHLNVQHEKPTPQCTSCHKHLAPFYYFDDRFSPVPADLTLRPPQAQGEVRPIQGLTVYWETF